MDDARRKKKKVKKLEEYMPTQEELLEEAKITEEENIKSLGKNKSCNKCYPVITLHIGK